MTEELSAADVDFYGLVAEFANESDLVAATRHAHEEGYRQMDAFAPYPIEELADALGFHHTHMPLIVLIGGIIGGISGFGLQYWVSVIAYPINVGGRPLNSWPAFIPVTFETTVLIAGLFAVFGMLALNGLPQPYHPLFNVSRFSLATQDRFFLCIEADDPHFDYWTTKYFLQDAGAQEVYDVPC